MGFNLYILCSQGLMFLFFVLFVMKFLTSVFSNNKFNRFFNDIHWFLMIDLRLIFITLAFCHDSQHFSVNLQDINYYLIYMSLFEHGSIINIYFSNKRVTYKRIIYILCCILLLIGSILHPNKITLWFFVINYLCDLLRHLFRSTNNIHVLLIYSFVKPLHLMYILMYSIFCTKITLHWFNTFTHAYIVFIALIDSYDRLSFINK